MQKEHAVLVLAAGSSSRMGQGKCELTLPSGKSFLEHIVTEYLGSGARQIGIVLNEEGMAFCKRVGMHENERISLVLNPNPERGRSGSIKLGIRELGIDLAILIQNVDNPNVPVGIVKKMLDNLEKGYWVRPVYDKKGGHPICISKEIAEHMIDELRDDQPLNEYLKKFESIEVETEDDGILVNMNTLEDYRGFFDSIKQKKIFG